MRVHACIKVALVSVFITCSQLKLNVYCSEMLLVFFGHVMESCDQEFEVKCATIIDYCTTMKCSRPKVCAFSVRTFFLLFLQLPFLNLQNEMILKENADFCCCCECVLLMYNHQDQRFG